MQKIFSKTLTWEDILHRNNITILIYIIKLEKATERSIKRENRMRSNKTGKDRMVMGEQ